MIYYPIPMHLQPAYKKYTYKKINLTLKNYLKQL